MNGKEIPAIAFGALSKNSNIARSQGRCVVALPVVPAAKPWYNQP
jgi:hypothetical protein